MIWCVNVALRFELGFVFLGLWLRCWNLWFPLGLFRICCFGFCWFCYFGFRCFDLFCLTVHAVLVLLLVLVWLF